MNWCSALIAKLSSVSWKLVKGISISLRDQPGLLFLKLKGCDEQSFIRFVLVKTKNSNDWTFIKYNNCGQEISFKVQSKALPFYEKNRALIKSDSLEERVAIDHTKFYSFYEFRKGKLVTYKSFCKECTDWDEDRLIKERNQNKSLYKFFAQLDLELDKLIDKQPQSEL